MIKQLLWVGLGGGVGSMLRFLSSHYVHKLSKGVFPWGTFTVNILGCLLIGILVAWFAKLDAGSNTLKWLFISGFCGGYTTFSAFAFENIQLLQQQQYLSFALYTAASLLIGFVAVAIGLYLFR
jgi:CrcB protein